MAVADNGEPVALSWRRASELIRTHTREVASSLLCRSPLASVCVMAYNHGAYIGQALESILEQQTAFPFEIVVGDDHSCDGTTEIILNFQKRHPERIRVLLADENLGSYTGNGRLNLLRVLLACRGRYVAFLEGDDFWTDTGKLNWGVAFLKRNPSFSAVFHNLLIEYPDGSSRVFYSVDDWSSPQLPLPRAVTGFNDLLRGNYIHVSALLARRIVPDESTLDQYLTLHYGDWFLALLHAGRNNIFFLDLMKSCYRNHGAGVYSKMGAKTQSLWYLRDKERISLMFRDVSPEIVDDNLRGVVRRTWVRDTGAGSDAVTFESDWRKTIHRKVFAYTRASISRLGVLLDTVEMLRDCSLEGDVVAFCDDAGGEIMAIALGLIRQGEHERNLILIPVDQRRAPQHSSVATTDHDATAVLLAVLSTGYPEQHVQVQRVDREMPPGVLGSVAMLVLPEFAGNIAEEQLNSILTEMVSGGIIISGDQTRRYDPQLRSVHFESPLG